MILDCARCHAVVAVTTALDGLVLLTILSLPKSNFLSSSWLGGLTSRCIFYSPEPYEACSMCWVHLSRSILPVHPQCQIIHMAGIGPHNSIFKCRYAVGTP